MIFSNLATAGTIWIGLDVGQNTHGHIVDWFGLGQSASGCIGFSKMGRPMSNSAIPCKTLQAGGSVETVRAGNVAAADAVQNIH